MKILLIGCRTWPGSCRGPLVPWRSWSTPWQQPAPSPRCCHRPPSERNLFLGKTGWQEHPARPGNTNKNVEIKRNGKFIRSSLNVGAGSLSSREGEFYSIYLGAMHKLSCQADVLHAAGAQQGLDKNLPQNGNKRRFNAGRDLLWLNYSFTPVWHASHFICRSSVIYRPKFCLPAVNSRHIVAYIPELNSSTNRSILHILLSCDTWWHVSGFRQV